jgi:iron complex outermembrane receptor protein
MMKPLNLPCATALALVLATPAFAETARAQAGSTPKGDQLEELIVTARKVEENLQDVPVAVTVHTGVELKRQNASRIQDIAAFVPGLTIRPGATTATGINFTIRGEAQTNSVATQEAPVGVYLDGMYISRPFGINTDLLDIENIQTLKGPQGTLFGRNTPGGAVLIQTKNPNLTEFGGEVSATYGRYDRQGGSLILNVPLLKDKVALRVALSTDRRDGYITETLTGTKLDSVDDQAARVKLLVAPTDKFRVLLSAETTQTGGFGPPYRATYISPLQATTGLEVAIDALGPSCNLPANRAACIAQSPGLIAAALAQAKTDKFPLNDLPAQRSVTHTYNITASLDTSVGVLKFIGGKRYIKQVSIRDVDGSPFNFADNGQMQDLNETTAELQITGTTLGDKLSYAGGVYYFKEGGLDFSTSNSLDAVNPNNPAYFDTTIAAKSKAIYGQVTYHLTDRLALTGGLRYSKERKGVTLRTRTYTAAVGAFVCSLNVCPSSRSDPFSGTDYMVSADYRVTDDILAYAKRSRGFRSGGQNGRAFGAISAFLPFGPETTIANEIGVKSELFNRRVRLNVAAYDNRIKDIQRGATLIVGTRAAGVTANAGEAAVKGAEVELDALLVQDFRVSATAAYSHANYLDYVDPGTGFDKSREKLQGSPPWSFTIAGTYTHDFDFGHLLLRADYVWTSDTTLGVYNYYTDANGVVREATGGTPVNLAVAQALVKANTDQATGVLGARASLTFDDGRYEVSAFARNITNKRDRLAAALFPAPFDSNAAVLREPRTWGVSATYRW